MTPRGFFGGTLVAIGGFIAFCAGLCSLAVTLVGGAGLVGQIFNGHFRISSIFGGIGVVGVVGGIPFLIGWGMYKLGKKLLKN